MFSFQMVAKELNQIYDQATLTKTASYETMISSSNGQEELCEIKLRDLEKHVKEMNKQLVELRLKIAHINNQD